MIKVYSFDLAFGPSSYVQQKVHIHKAENQSPTFVALSWEDGDLEWRVLPPIRAQFGILVLFLILKSYMKPTLVFWFHDRPFC